MRVRGMHQRLSSSCSQRALFFRSGAPFCSDSHAHLTQDETLAQTTDSTHRARHQRATPTQRGPLGHPWVVLPARAGGPASPWPAEPRAEPRSTTAAPFLRPAGPEPWSSHGSTAPSTTGWSTSRRPPRRQPRRRSTGPHVESTASRPPRNRSVAASGQDRLAPAVTRWRPGHTGWQHPETEGCGHTPMPRIRRPKDHRTKQQPKTRDAELR